MLFLFATFSASTILEISCDLRAVSPSLLTDFDFSIHQCPERMSGRHDREEWSVYLAFVYWIYCYGWVGSSRPRSIESQNSSMLLLRRWKQENVAERSNVREQRPFSSPAGRSFSSSSRLSSPIGDDTCATAAAVWSSSAFRSARWSLSALPKVIWAFVSLPICFW